MDKPHVHFNHPFSMIIAGPTQCGKTVFLKKLLRHAEYIKPRPKEIVWCYGIKSSTQFKDLYKESAYPIQFHKGLPNVGDIPKNSLVVIDDLMADAAKSKLIASFFTQGMHHNEISIVLLVQNIFCHGKEMRNISLNAQYIVLFKNPRDSQQIKFLSNQIFPLYPKYLPDAYRQATERPYGYLVINLTQSASDNLRLITNIFPDERCHYFVPLEEYTSLN